jgi:hypothetical protein
MPVARFEMPDGRIGRFEVPEGTTPEQAQALIAQSLPQPAPEKPGMLRNIGMGALKGASDIGSTLLRPVDAALNAAGLTQTTNADRRAGLRSFFRENADTDSLAFKGAELAADIAGTAGVGGVLAKPVAAIAPRLAAALSSGGFSLGAGLRLLRLPVKLAMRRCVRQAVRLLAVRLRA